MMMTMLLMLMTTLMMMTTLTMMTIMTWSQFLPMVRRPWADLAAFE
jgi:hypothetical protein